ncbi:MAG: glycosyltransferase family 2 protein [Rikenellaceae bacterium]
MDISVIVPIYNVESVLERCLLSLFNQTKTDGVEFIFVNDATEDGSMSVLCRVAAEYPQHNIRIVEHQTNRGLATARQTGFDTSIGDYIIHIDSDDWCERDMLEAVYAKAIEHDADIVACDFFDRDGNIFCNHHSDSKFENLEGLISSNTPSPSLWSKLIRRELYLRNGLKCDNGINYGEDTLLSPMLYYVADKVSYLPKAYVHYTFRDESLTNNCDVNSFLEYIKVSYAWDSFFADTPEYPRLKSKICEFRLLQKHELLRNSRGVEQRKYNRMFPVSFGSVFGSKRLSVSMKVSFIFANMGLLVIFNILYGLRNKYIG